MAAALIGRERSEREERNLEVLNRRAANIWLYKSIFEHELLSGMHPFYVRQCCLHFLRVHVRGLKQIVLSHQ